MHDIHYKRRRRLRVKLKPKKRRVGWPSAMDALDPGIITNDDFLGAGEDFTPRPTARRSGKEAEPTWQEDFVRKAAPKALTASVVVAQSNYPFVTGLMVPIQKIALPIAMPVNVQLRVQLAADSNPTAAAPRLPAQFEAVLAGTPPPAFVGQFIVEYGWGDYSETILVDMKATSLQLPKAQFVNVFAWYAQRDDSNVGTNLLRVEVALAPGYNVVEQNATNTIVGVRDSLGTIFSLPVPARAKVVGLSTRGDAAGSNARHDLLSGLGAGPPIITATLTGFPLGGFSQSLEGIAVGGAGITSATAVGFAPIAQIAVAQIFNIRP